VERLRTEDERMTVAIANGFAISQSKDALKAWQAAHPARQAPPTEASRAAFWASIVEIQSIFPGAVRIKGKLPTDVH
jgi:hypothetical protein